MFNASMFLKIIKNQSAYPKKLCCGGFSLLVRKNGREEDRVVVGNNTAKTFYAASIFFEILFQFGEVQPDLQEKQKYAVWKATDIRKAIKEGRKPVPGPPGSGGDTDPIDSPSSAYTNRLSIYGSVQAKCRQRIAEAQRATRFAVGALAFDDVFVAVDYLKKSLELLTNPSASV
nr:protein homolog of mammalian LYST-interacting protein 5 [Tanacetum cinerariifolium]